MASAAATQAAMAQLLASMTPPPNAAAIPVTLPAPPKLVGALEQNAVLQNAVKFAENIGVVGPESFVVVNGWVYTGTNDGYLYEINDMGKPRKITRMADYRCNRFNPPPTGSCGRPLGIRKDKRNYLVVADAYKGIFTINPRNPKDWRQLVVGESNVNGKKLGFINDLAISSSGLIFFTSSSSKWDNSRYLDIILEGETSGRVMVFNPQTRRVEELVTNLNFPNGLEISADEDFLLIGEGARARIFKAYIGKNHPKRGQIEIFAENLPGFVDNIRRTSRGTFWVGLSRVRYDGAPSVLDTYGDNPDMRNRIMGMPREMAMSRAPKYGIAIELGASGKILRSIHDPEGKMFDSVSELQEENGFLYIGSFDRPYVGRLKMADLPQALPDTQEATNGTDSGTTPAPGDQGNANDNADINRQLQLFLTRIQQRLISMNKPQTDSIVLALVEALVNAKVAELKAQKALARTQEQLKNLQNQVGGGDSSTPSPSAGTTPSGTSATTPIAGDQGQGSTNGGSTSGSTQQTTPTSNAQATTQGSTSGGSTGVTDQAQETTQASTSGGSGSTAQGAGTTQASTQTDTTAAGATGSTGGDTSAATGSDTTASGGETTPAVTGGDTASTEAATSTAAPTEATTTG